MMTLSEYAEALEARAKMLKAGKPEGAGAVTIERWVGRSETPAWTAWVRYWTIIGARATLEVIEGRTSWTVPTLNPWEFDVGYNG